MGGGENPYPARQLQVRPCFRIYRAINGAANKGVNIPATEDGDQFCLSFHLKGVHNSNCGGRHSHRALSQSEFGRFDGWHEKFCKE